ncbi:hypothetical protein PENTCL1PPCAC_25555, partial [Pristionchus entomophagus]
PSTEGSRVATVGLIGTGRSIPSPSRASLSTILRCFEEIGNSTGSRESFSIKMLLCFFFFSSLRFN